MFEIFVVVALILLLALIIFLNWGIIAIWYYGAAAKRALVRSQDPAKKNQALLDQQKSLKAGERAGAWRGLNFKRSTDGGFGPINVNEP